MDNLPVLRQTERFGATIEEQIGLEANKRMGEPGQRQPIGISLSVCKVYAEVRPSDSHETCRHWPEIARI